MKAGFRAWLYRWVSACLGLVGLLVSLTLAEVSRFYGFPSLSAPAWIGLGLSFLIGVTALLGVWSWRRYAILCGVLAMLCAFPYLVFRPEMFRDDVLRQLPTPPLSVDLVIYRGWVLRSDPEREAKIERLQMIYGLLKSYGESRRAPIPEGK